MKFSSFLKNGMTEEKNLIKPFKEQYPELYDAAVEISKETARQINAAAQRIESKMPYKAQAILEEVIKILESKV